MEDLPRLRQLRPAAAGFEMIGGFPSSQGPLRETLRGLNRDVAAKCYFCIFLIFAKINHLIFRRSRQQKCLCRCEVNANVNAFVYKFIST